MGSLTKSLFLLPLSWAKHLEQWIFPPYCDICGGPREKEALLCSGCAEGMVFLREFPCCRKCSKPYPGALDSPESCPECLDRKFYFERACSVYQNKGAAHDLVLRLKYAKGLHLAPLFAKEIWNHLKDEEDFPFGDMVVAPVPQTLFSRLKRGYNQAEEIARCLAGEGELPFYSLLRKSPMAKSQTRLNRRERLVLNRKSVSVKKEFRGRASFEKAFFLLVDDVYTTGSTLSECARAIRKEFPEARIAAVTFLRS